MLKKLLTFVICLLFLSSIADAWKAGYGYRKQFTVKGGNLDANLTHFPIILVLVDSDIDDHCDDDGDRSHDILFTQADDTTLDIDWIDYSEAGGEATIVCVFSDAGWTINSGGTTTGWLYYGNAAAGDPATDQGVYDASYEAIFYGYDNTTATVFECVDLSHGDKTGVNTPVEATGDTYKAQDFGDNDDEWLFDTNEGYNTDAWTIQVHLYYPNSDNGIRYVTDGSTMNVRAVLAYTNTNKANIQNGGWPTGTQAETDIAISGNTWQQVAFVTDGTDLWGYLNGVEEWHHVGTDLDCAGQTNYFFGAKNNSTSALYGKLENMKVSSTNRSAAWLKFDWHNSHEADNELTWGAEEEAPTDGFVPKVIIIR